MAVMPDTRIYGGGDSGGQQPAFNPMQTLGAMMQIKEQQQLHQARQKELELKQREIDEDDDITATLQRYERPEEAAEDLQKRGQWRAFAKLSKGIHDERTARLAEDDAKTKSHQARLEQAAQILGGVTDDSSYQASRKAVLDLITPIYGATANDYLPTTYDEGVVKKLIAAGTTRAQQLQQSHNFSMKQIAAHQAGLISANQWAESEGMPVLDEKTGRRLDPDVAQWSHSALQAQELYQENMAQYMLQATNKQAWDDGLRLAHQNGTPKNIIDKFKTWNPETSPALARALSMSVKEAEAADTAGVRADTALENAKRTRERDTRRDAAAAESGGVTPAQTRVIRSDKNKQNADLETSWHDKFDKTAGVRPAGASRDTWQKPDYDLTKLDKRDQQEYVRRRLQIENDERELLGRPPLIEAARAAVAEGDTAGYRKIEKVYNDLTQGLVPKLGELVKPPSGNAGVISPTAAAARRNRAREIMNILKTETDPAKVKALTDEYKELGAALR